MEYSQQLPSCTPCVEPFVSTSHSFDSGSDITNESKSFFENIELDLHSESSVATSYTQLLCSIKEEVESDPEPSPKEHKSTLVGQMCNIPPLFDDCRKVYNFSFPDESSKESPFDHLQDVSSFNDVWKTDNDIDGCLSKADTCFQNQCNKVSESFISSVQGQFQISEGVISSVQDQCNQISESFISSVHGQFQISEGVISSVQNQFLIRTIDAENKSISTKCVDGNHHIRDKPCSTQYIKDKLSTPHMHDKPSSTQQIKIELESTPHNEKPRNTQHNDKPSSVQHNNDKPGSTQHVEDKPGSAQHKDKPGSAQHKDKPGSTQHVEDKPGSTQHVEDKPGSAQHNDKPGSAQHNDKPGSTQHNDKPGSTQHKDKPGSAQHKDKPGSTQHVEDKPGSTQHKDKPGSTQHVEDKPGSAQHNDKPGSTQHNDKPRSTQHKDKPGSTQHVEEKPGSTQHVEDKPGSTQHKDKPGSTQHVEDKPGSTQHVEEKPGSTQHKDKPGSTQHKDKPGSTQHVEDTPGSTQHKDKPGSTQHIQDKPGSTQHIQDKPGSTQHNVKPGSAQHNVKPGSTQHNVKPGSTQHKDKPGSAQHKDKPGSTQHVKDKPGSTQHVEDKPGSTQHVEDKPGSTQHVEDKPGSTQHVEDKPGSTQHKDKPGSAQHVEDKPGSTQHVEDKPGSAQHKDTPGSTQHKDKPGSTQHKDKPGSTQHNDKPGSTQHKDKPGSAQHVEDKPGSAQHKDKPGSTQNKDKPGSTQHEDKPGSTQHVEDKPSRKQNAENNPNRQPTKNNILPTRKAASVVFNERLQDVPVQWRKATHGFVCEHARGSQRTSSYNTESQAKISPGWYSTWQDRSGPMLGHVPWVTPQLAPPMSYNYRGDSQQAPLMSYNYRGDSQPAPARHNYQSIQQMAPPDHRFYHNPHCEVPDVKYGNQGPNRQVVPFRPLMENSAMILSELRRQQTSHQSVLHATSHQSQEQRKRHHPPEEASSSPPKFLRGCREWTGFQPKQDPSSCQPSVVSNQNSQSQYPNHIPPSPFLNEHIGQFAQTPHSFYNCSSSETFPYHTRSHQFHRPPLPRPPLPRPQFHRPPLHCPPLPRPQFHRPPLLRPPLPRTLLHCLPQSNSGNKCTKIRRPACNPEQQSARSDNLLHEVNTNLSQNSGSTKPVGGTNMTENLRLFIEKLKAFPGKENSIQTIENCIAASHLPIKTAYVVDKTSQNQAVVSGALYINDVFITRSSSDGRKMLKHKVYDTALQLLKSRGVEEVMAQSDLGQSLNKLQLLKSRGVEEVMAQSDSGQSLNKLQLETKLLADENFESGKTEEEVTADIQGIIKQEEDKQVSREHSSVIRLKEEECLDRLIQDLKLPAKAGVSPVMTIDKNCVQMKMKLLAVYKTVHSPGQQTLITCDLYILDRLLAQGKASTRKMAQADAYSKSGKILMKSTAADVLTAFPRFSEDELNKPDVMEVVYKGYSKVCESNRCRLNRLKQLPEENRTISQLVIIEHKDWAEDRKKHSHCILTQSATQCGFLLEWTTEPENGCFRCTIKLQGEEISSVLAKQRKTAVGMASSVALFNLYETQPVVQGFQLDYPKVWISRDDLVKYSQSHPKDCQATLQDRQATLEDHQATLQDHQAALQDSQATLQDCQAAPDVQANGNGEEIDEPISRAMQEMLDQFFSRSTLEDFVGAPDWKPEEKKRLRILAIARGLRVVTDVFCEERLTVINQKYDLSEMVTILGNQANKSQGRYRLLPQEEKPSYHDIAGEVAANESIVREYQTVIGVADQHKPLLDAVDVNEEAIINNYVDSASVSLGSEDCDAFVTADTSFFDVADVKEEITFYVTQPTEMPLPTGTSTPVKAEAAIASCSANEPAISKPASSASAECHRTKPASSTSDECHRTKPALSTSDECHRTKPASSTSDECHRTTHAEVMLPAIAEPSLIYSATTSATSMFDIEEKYQPPSPSTSSALPLTKSSDFKVQQMGRPLDQSQGHFYNRLSDFDGVSSSRTGTQPQVLQTLPSPHQTRQKKLKRSFDLEAGINATDHVLKVEGWSHRQHLDQQQWIEQEHQNSCQGGFSRQTKSKKML